MAEVFGLDLRAELVTLSACNTGLGRVSGEGVVGLARAFIYAGTASVLVSLWRVADTVATTEMERFYRGLIRTGGNKAAALAAAQREMIALLREGRIRVSFGARAGRGSSPVGAVRARRRSAVGAGGPRLLRSAR